MGASVTIALDAMGGDHGPSVVVPGAAITWSGDRLPFPSALEAVGFDRDVGPFPRTSLADGVANEREGERARDDPPLHHVIFESSRCDGWVVVG